MKHQTVSVFKALADDTRLAIVRKLAQEADTVSSCDIVSTCATFHALSQPAMSHHFGKLVEAGVVVEEKKGTHKSYTLNLSLLESCGIDAKKV